MKRFYLKQWFSEEKIKAISDVIIKNGTASGIDKMGYNTFIQKKNAIIQNISTSILSKNYKFQKYKEKLISKGRNKYPRVISIPTYKDKITLKILQNIIENHFPNARTRLPQSIIKDLKNEYNRFDYLLKFDIKNFYGEINHRVLMNKLEQKISSKYVLKLIKTAIRNSIAPDNTLNMKGVHQGISISNVLAEVYLQDLDELMMSNSNISYHRYVDDILILCQKNDKNNIENIIFSNLNLLKLETSENKNKSSDLSSCDFDYLGYNFCFSSIKGIINLKLRPTSRSIARFHDRISREISRFKDINRQDDSLDSRFIFELNLLLTGSVGKHKHNDIEIDKRYGWHFFYSQITDYKILYETDSLVRKMILKNSIKIGEKPKKVSTAFFENKYNFASTNYFFKPDKLNLSEKKQLLMDIYKIPEIHLQNQYSIERQFYINVYKKIYQLEVDLIVAFS